MILSTERISSRFAGDFLHVDTASLARRYVLILLLYEYPIHYNGHRSHGTNGLRTAQRGPLAT